MLVIHVCESCKQDHLRMNVAPDQTIIFGQQIFLDHRPLSSIDQKILMTLAPLPPHPHTIQVIKVILVDT